MPSTPRSGATIYAHVDPPLKKHLDAFARSRGTTATAVLEDALRRYFADPPPPPPPLPPLPKPPPRPRGRPRKDSRNNP